MGREQEKVGKLCLNKCSGGLMYLISEVEALAKKKGVECVVKANGHVQLKGDLLVNYYPESKKQTAYVAGTTAGKKRVSPEEAIEMCFKAPELIGRKDNRSANSKRKRQALFKKGVNKCHWCGVDITVDSSTLEHIIPLARGGLDNANNRALACGK